MNGLPLARYSLFLLFATMVTVLIFSAETQAATVAMGSMHMAGAPDARQPARDHFPSGVTTVYFDYAVLAPYAGDAGRAIVYAGGTRGTPVAEAPLVLSLPTALSVSLRPSSSPWPDGGYCTVLVLNGQPDTMNGRMPIGWTVGNATVPRACAPRLHVSVKIGGSPRGYTLRLTVTDPHHGTVAGAEVRVDGRSAGLRRTLSARTGPKGRATFRNLHGLRAGTVLVTASHTGYRTTAVSLPVHP